MKTAAAVLLALAVVGAACSSDSTTATRASDTTSTSREATTTTTSPGMAMPDPVPIEAGQRLPADLLFVYADGAGVSGVLTTGRRVALTGVGTTPQLEADGHTILYMRGEHPDAETVALDVRTGTQTLLGKLEASGEMSPNGELAIPVSGAERGPVTIAVLSRETYRVAKTITLGSDSVGKNSVFLAWDTDRVHLLAFTWDTESGWAWWWIDTDEARATQLDVPDGLNPSQHYWFFLAPARAPGDFPMLSARGWGELHVRPGAQTTFSKADEPGPRGPGESAVVGFSDLGGKRVGRVDADTFAVQDSAAGGRLVQYWTRYEDNSGRLLYVAPNVSDTLLEHVAWIDTP